MKVAIFYFFIFRLAGEGKNIFIMESSFSAGCSSRGLAEMTITAVIFYSTKWFSHLCHHVSIPVGMSLKVFNLCSPSLRTKLPRKAPRAPQVTSSSTQKQAPWFTQSWWPGKSCVTLWVSSRATSPHEMPWWTSASISRLATWTRPSSLSSWSKGLWLPCVGLGWMEGVCFAHLIPVVSQVTVLGVKDCCPNFWWYLFYFHFFKRQKAVIIFFSILCLEVE